MKTPGKGLPKTIKDESIGQEEEITKKLYKDYSQFIRELHQNIIEHNPTFDALSLYTSIFGIYFLSAIK